MSGTIGFSLFEYLYDISAYSERVQTIVVSHSQGNLITGNVAWFLLATLHPLEIPRRMKVFALATPNPSWPNSGRRNFYYCLYRDPRDPVTLVGLPWLGTEAREVRGNSPIDGLDFTFATHDVRLYLLTERFLSDLAAEF
jgi:hypothetical protein